MKSIRLPACVLPVATLMLAALSAPTLRAQAPASTPAAATAETSPVPTASPANASPTQEQEKSAQLAAETWLALLDEGKYAESWQTAASFFQAAIPQDKWTGQLGMVRAAFGKANGRKLRVIKYMTTVPGAPDGQYVVLQYETVFENKKNAVETVTPMLDKDGAWKVSGYYIK